MSDGDVWVPAVGVLTKPPAQGCPRPGAARARVYRRVMLLDGDAMLEERQIGPNWWRITSWRWMFDHVRDQDRRAVKLMIDLYPYIVVAEP